MRKIFIVIISLLAPALVLASPCDGRNVSIVNNTHVKYTVSQADTGNSSIDPLASAFVIPRETSILSVVQSGNGSYGNAKGTIELMSSFYPGKIIRLNYGYSKYLPFWCHSDDPSAEFDKPFRVTAYLDGSTTIFEINGVFNDEQSES